MIDLIELTKLADEADTIFLGDIIDIKNAKSFTEARHIYFRLKAAMGDRYVTGNHETHMAYTPVYAEGKIVFTHGDGIIHGPDYVEKWKNALPVSKFQRVFIVLQNFIADRIPIRLGLSKKAKERAHKLMARHDCDCLVMGHTHVKSTKAYCYRGKLILVVPRGTTMILGHKVVADVHLLGCHRNI